MDKQRIGNGRVRERGRVIGRDDDDDDDDGDDDDADDDDNDGDDNDDGGGMATNVPGAKAYRVIPSECTRNFTVSRYACQILGMITH